MKHWVLVLVVSFTALAGADTLSAKPAWAFEANKGQSPDEYKFVAMGLDRALLLSPTSATVRQTTGTVRILWRGGKRRVAMDGQEPRAGKVNYLLGNRSSRWIVGIQTYAKVRYKGIYPGVDLLFHGTPDALEFDFVVAPGRDPSVIRLSFEGASEMKIEASGDLVLAESRLRLCKPVVYQDGPHGRRYIEGGYSALGKTEAGFRIAGYDRSRPLVIDPVLSFSTYLGGSAAENVTAGGDMKSAGIATDQDGNVYVTGSTSSADFLAGNKLGSAETGSADLFVAKFNPAGEMLYTTRIGGSGLERGFGIAVDSSGNAYLAGRTQSVDFPLANPAQAVFGGKEDVFVLKLNPAGDQLLYATYLGGNETDFACGIAVDAMGSAFVTGDAVSSNFPVTQGALQRQYGGGGSDAFVTKLGPSGSLAYSTYLGGQGFDHGESLAVDGGGSVYLTGYTASRDFPTAHPYQAALNGPLDVFVARMNEAGAALIYSTYLGGAGPEGGVSVAVDASGNAYVAGATQSPDFPATQGAVQVSFRGEQDGFLTKLSPEGTAVLFSTYLGGTKADSATGVAVDAEGNSYVVGSTRSPDFLVVDAFQAAHAGNDEVFIAKVNAAGSAFIHSSFLGGSGWDLGYAIAVDKSGNIYVTGRTDSADFPTLNAYQAVNKGNRDAFVARIAEGASSATFFTVSAASFASAAPLAAEAIAAGYGANLVPAIDIAPAAGPLPIVLGEVSVKVRDGAGVERTAPLWFVSPGQINYYIPEVTALGLATITVTRGSQIIASGRLQIDRVAPGLFAANSNGQGVAAALAIYKSGQPWQYVFNVGCTVGSCRPVPIDLGLPSEQVYLQLYGTGIRGRSSLAAVTATIGGVAAAVEYAGPVEGMVGLDQVNLPVPRSLIGRGTVDIVLTVDGKTTNAVTVGVK